jgi:hypothetical protein
MFLEGEFLKFSTRWLLGANPRFGRAAPGTAAGRALFSYRIVTV